MRQAARRRSRPGTIRSRLTGILAIPLVGILVLLGNLIYDEIDEVAAANEITASTSIVIAAQNLVNELQHERGLTMGLLAGAPDDREELNLLRPQVDRVRAALAGMIVGDSGTHASVRGALARLDDLTAVRAQVDAVRIDRSTAFQYFSDRIATLNDVDIGADKPAPAADPTLRRALAAFGSLGTAREAAASEAALLVGTLTVGHFSGDEYVGFATAQVRRQLALTEFSRYATAPTRSATDAASRSPDATDAIRYEQSMFGAADGRRIGIDEETWWLAMTGYVERLRTVQTAIGAEIHRRTDELRRAASWRMIFLGPVGLIMIVVAVWLVRYTAGSIVRPLTALVGDANEIAGRRLPEAVAMAQAGETAVRPPAEIRAHPGATAEIVAVADSVNRMGRTAIDLAVEQAALRRTTIESLANLGRRTQNLLRRQLAFISQLEREESDPDALANLFELDHLATRLRRNAESLLVLVGEQAPRRWSSPLPIVDVIRAAVAEVEEYRRVALRRADPGFLGGRYVTDLAHLLAELIENSLSFSPPEEPVEIHGRQSGNRYLIAIVDHGVGMSADDLAIANARLRGEESFTVAPTRFLGHYVVGKLARELDIDVQIVQSPVTGVTARILLPQALLGAEPLTDQASAVVEAVPAPRRSHDSQLSLVDGSGWAGPPVTVTSEIPITGHVGDPRDPAPRRPEHSAPVRTDGGTAVDRTRNGLPKRRTRPRRAAVPGQSGSRHLGSGTIRPDFTSTPNAGPNPTTVRSTLTALRDGVERGHHSWLDEQL